MKAILSLGAIPLVLILMMTQTAMATLSPGMQAARQDFAAGNQRDDSCNDHGYNSVQNPGFCLTFKIDYDIQWAILVLAH